MLPSPRTRVKPTSIRREHPAKDVGEHGAGEDEISRHDPGRMDGHRTPRRVVGQAGGQFAAKPLDPLQVSRPLADPGAPALGYTLDADASPDNAAEDRGRRIR